MCFDGCDYWRLSLVLVVGANLETWGVCAELSNDDAEEKKRWVGNRPASNLLMSSFFSLFETQAKVWGGLTSLVSDLAAPEDE